MSKETPICPVCGNALKVAGVDPNMYYCPKRKIWFPDIGAHIDTIEATIYIDASGRHTLQIIEVPPYRFTITDEDKIQKTEISKIAVRQDRVHSYKWYPQSITRDPILILSTALKLPWNNKEKVLERMKLFLLFS